MKNVFAILALLKINNKRRGRRTCLFLFVQRNILSAKSAHVVTHGRASCWAFSNSSRFFYLKGGGNMLTRVSDVLGEISGQIRKGNEENLQQLVNELAEKLHKEERDDEHLYAEFSEVETMAYTARCLNDEANGYGRFTPNWPDDHLRRWRDDCLLPFLETVSYRLPYLMRHFKELIEEGILDRPSQEEAPVLTKEELEARQKEDEEFKADLDFRTARRMVAAITEMYPGIRGDLAAALEKVKPAEEQEDPGQEE